jgi:hypothetical protein
MFNPQPPQHPACGSARGVSFEVASSKMNLCASKMVTTTYRQLGLPVVTGNAHAEISAAPLCRRFRSLRDFEHEPKGACYDDDNRAGPGTRRSSVSVTIAGQTREPLSHCAASQRERSFTQGAKGANASTTWRAVASVYPDFAAAHRERRSRSRTLP